LQSEDERPKDVDVLQHGQRRVVGRQPLIVLGHGGHGRDCAHPAVSLGVCRRLSMRPRRLFLPEGLERCHGLGVLSQRRRHLLQAAGQQPPSP
jgi:hypothetical protein